MFSTFLLYSWFVVILNSTNRKFLNQTSILIWCNLHQIIFGLTHPSKHIYFYVFDLFFTFSQHFWDVFDISTTIIGPKFHCDVLSGPGSYQPCLRSQFFSEKNGWDLWGSSLKPECFKNCEVGDPSLGFQRTWGLVNYQLMQLMYNSNRTDCSAEKHGILNEYKWIITWIYGLRVQCQDSPSETMHPISSNTRASICTDFRCAVCSIAFQSQAVGIVPGDTGIDGSKRAEHNSLGISYKHSQITYSQKPHRNDMKWGGKHCSRQAIIFAGTQVLRCSGQQRCWPWRQSQLLLDPASRTMISKYIRHAVFIICSSFYQYSIQYCLFVLWFYLCQQCCDCC